MVDFTWCLWWVVVPTLEEGEVVCDGLNVPLGVYVCARVWVQLFYFQLS